MHDAVQRAPLRDQGQGRDGTQSLTLALVAPPEAIGVNQTDDNGVERGSAGRLRRDKVVRRCQRRAVSELHLLPLWRVKHEDNRFVAWRPICFAQA
jgi:hypothetical protein